MVAEAHGASVGHLRSFDNREEIDLIVDSNQGQLVGIEIRRKTTGVLTLHNGGPCGTRTRDQRIISFTPPPFRAFRRARDIGRTVTSLAEPLE